MLKAKFRFRLHHRDSYDPNPPWHLRTLFVALTDQCNLHCHYCHTEASKAGRSLPLPLVERILDQACDMGRPTIGLTGGEPFCHPHWAEVLRLCRDRQLKCKIATNGTLLDRAAISTLTQHDVSSIQVSLDTVAPDLYAQMKGVAPRVHAQVVEAIKECARLPRFHVVVSSVCHKRVSGGLPDLLALCHDLGVGTFTLFQLIPFGRAPQLLSLRLDEREFLGTIDTLIEAFQTLNRHGAVEVAVPWAIESDLVRRWEHSIDIRALGCLAGKSAMTVLANGDVVPCVCCGDRAFVCGNVNDTSLRQMWDAPTMRYFRGETPIEGCADCPTFDLCKGGCRTLAYLSSGRADGPQEACPQWRSPVQREVHACS